MTFSFRPAVRENASLLIGLAGASGSGKTYSAMRLAKGIAGDRPFAVIDTEAGRATHYTDQFRFDHGDLRAPFSPQAYAEAIRAADAAGYPVVVIDSMSHEWAGEGGVLDAQERELDAMVERAMGRRQDAQEWKLRESMARSAWIKPKKAHKQMMYGLLQTRASVIFCLRAEDKIDFVEVDGKKKAVPMTIPGGYKGWIPICDKRFLFELTASFILLPDSPGIPQPIKLEAQHRPMFPQGRVITEEAGVGLAAWARGGVAPAAAPATVKPPAKGAQLNTEPGDCTYCEGTVEPGEGWQKDGRVIHKACAETKKKELARTG